MTTADSIPPPGFDEALLRDLVPRMLRDPTAELATWRCARLDYGGSNPVSGGLYRLAGTARADGATAPWSLILKVVCSPASLDERAHSSHVAVADDTGHWNYWKREILAYQSGLLDDLGGGLAAPRCYGITEQPGETVWLWLEEVVDDYTAPWPLERYGLAARHLGTWQGAYLAGRPLPDAAWLASGWLRSWRANFAAMDQLAADSAAWERPDIRHAFGRPVRVAYQRLASDEQAWQDVLDGLPQTLCHYDFLRPNLFARHVGGQEQTIAIDWSYVGYGPVGEDAAILIFGSLLRPDTAVKEIAELDRTVFAGYLAGLRAAGWQGDPGLVRMSFGMAAAMHTGLNLPLLILLALMDETSHAWMEQHWGYPIRELVAHWGPLCCYLLDLADEARGLLAQR